MSHKDTKVMFATKEDKPKKSFEKPWRILIVDDEPEVHNVTHLILGKENFNGRNLELISAYSAEEAKKIMAREDDIAVVLLDVVMETSTAGLDAAEYIRNELGNKIVRVILRTGQPGEAPDKRVIVDYDINDYKEKSELTSNKLFTSVVAALRSYTIPH